MGRTNFFSGNWLFAQMNIASALVHGVSLCSYHKLTRQNFDLYGLNSPRQPLPISNEAWHCGWVLMGGLTVLDFKFWHQSINQSLNITYLNFKFPQSMNFLNNTLDEFTINQFVLHFRSSLLMSFWVKVEIF